MYVAYGHVFISVTLQIVYGNIEVTMVEEERVPSCYLVSHLSVKNMTVSSVRDACTEATTGA